VSSLVLRATKLAMLGDDLFAHCNRTYGFQTDEIHCKHSPISWVEPSVFYEVGNSDDKEQNDRNV